MILFVNSCTKKDSRTKKVADSLLLKLNDNVKEIKLFDSDFPKTDESFLKWRDGCIAIKDFSNKYFDFAKDFSSADKIVIAAPYWDLSFPAVLKQYIEHINVLGITFEYTEDGFPKGLCKAKELYYVMTAGGNYVPEEFGFGYIKSLSQNFYGISNFELVKATGLDIVGADSAAIVKQCIEKLSF